jgi:hypothetical protein
MGVCSSVHTENLFHKFRFDFESQSNIGQITIYHDVVFRCSISLNDHECISSSRDYKLLLVDTKSNVALILDSRTTYSLRLRNPDDITISDMDVSRLTWSSKVAFGDVKFEQIIEAAMSIYPPMELLASNYHLSKQLNVKHASIHGEAENIKTVARHNAQIQYEIGE